MELMVVIVIMGVLASLVVPNLMGNKDRADRQKAASDIIALENALDIIIVIPQQNRAWRRLLPPQRKLPGLKTTTRTVISAVCPPIRGGMTTS